MNTKEIHALRRKFIIIAMFSFLTVMVFIGTVINVVSHTVTIRSIKNTLNNIRESEGKLNDTPEIGEGDMPFMPSFYDAFSPKYRHNHYYMFIMDSSDDVTYFSSNAVNNTELELVRKYAEQILEDDDDFGNYGVYYFKKTEDDGTVILTILDCTSEISSSKRLLGATILTCIAAFVIAFILVRIFSWRLIQPEIENSERQKEFITNASHELKTPLAVIRANTELLEVTNGENEWTKSTLNQVDHMNGLIQNLVMIAKAEEREDKSKLAEINASEAVEQTVTPYKALAEQSGKNLKTNIEKDVMVTSDESKLRQLTTILVDNAIKYCDESGEVEVSLVPIKHGQLRMRLIVSNSYKDGAGIDCNRFFDRFYREDQSHNIDKGGYGIGLSIAESICRQYGGNIKAGWKDGVISFTVNL